MTTEWKVVSGCQVFNHKAMCIRIWTILPNKEYSVQVDMQQAGYMTKRKVYNDRASFEAFAAEYSAANPNLDQELVDALKHTANHLF